jgi:hypothetical protein
LLVLAQSAMFLKQFFESQWGVRASHMFQGANARFTALSYNRPDAEDVILLIHIVYAVF